MVGPCSEQPQAPFFQQKHFLVFVDIKVDLHVQRGGAEPDQPQPETHHAARGPLFNSFIDFCLIFHKKCMKINEIETSTNPSIFTNIGSNNHWGVRFILKDVKVRKRGGRKW